MTFLHRLLEPSLADRLGWTLLHLLWQGAAVAFLLKLFLLLAPRQSAQVRYLGACGAMLGLIAIPVITFRTLANVPVGVESTPALALAHTTQPQVFKGVDRPTLTMPSAGSFREISRPAFPAMADSRTVPTSNTTALASPPVQQRLKARVSAAMPWTVLIWAAGVLALSVWNIGGWLAVQQLKFLQTRPAGPAARQRLANLASRLNLHRPIRLMESALAQTPLVIGVFRPIILVPTSVMSDLPIAQLESILAHELAHILRHDYLVNLLQSVVETLLFYHPAVWWISRQIRVEREHCCDDLAVSITRDRATYVRALAAVASVRVPHLAPAAAGGKLLPRLKRILGVPEAESQRSPRWLAGAIVGICLVLALILRPQWDSSARAQTRPATQPVALLDDVVKVRGIVTGPDGKPFPGAKVVTAPKWPTLEGHPIVLSATQSGPDGRFEISFKKSEASVFSTGNGRPGDDLWKDLNIAASAPGFGLAWRQFDDVDETGHLTLALVPDISLEGRIVDLEAHPVPGINVTVTGMTSRILGPTDDQFYPPADYRGIANPLGIIGAAAPVVTDSDGWFVIKGLGKDRLVNLQFQNDRIAPLSQRVATREGPAPQGAPKSERIGNKFELIAAPPVTVTGAVRDDRTQKPLAGVTVRSSWSRAATTDQQGRYQINGLPQGAMDLTATSDNEPYVTSLQSIADHAGPGPFTVDFNLHRGVWITGKVIDRVTGAPVPAVVEYRPSFSNTVAKGIAIFQIGWGLSPLHGETKPDGTYRMVGVPGDGIISVLTRDGRYRQGVGFDQIKHPHPDVQEHRYNTAREINLPDETTPGTADFQLEPGTPSNTFHVTCVDPDGKPMAVSVVGDTASNWKGFVEYARGDFQVLGLSPGETRLLYIVNRGRKLGKVFPLNAKQIVDKNITIRLEPLATATGRLINSDGDPVRGGIRVFAIYPPVQSIHLDILIAECGADGRYTLYLPAGSSYNIGAFASMPADFKTFKNELTVTAGTTIDLGDVRVDQNMK